MGININVPNRINQNTSLHPVRSGSTAETDYNVKYVPQTLTEAQKAQARQNIGAGEPQVQADWNQTDTTAPDYIKNKPEITPGGATINEFHYLRDTTTDPATFYIDADGYEPQEGDLMTIVWDWPFRTNESEEVAFKNPATLKNNSTNPSIYIKNAHQMETDYDEIDPEVNTRWTVRLEKVNDVWYAYNISTAVQADWTTVDTHAPSYIKNKPEISDIFLEENMLEIRFRANGTVSFNVQKRNTDSINNLYIDGINVKKSSIATVTEASSAYQVSLRLGNYVGTHVIRIKMLSADFWTLQNVNLGNDLSGKIVVVGPIQSIGVNNPISFSKSYTNIHYTPNGIGSWHIFPNNVGGYAYLNKFNAANGNAGSRFNIVFLPNTDFSSWSTLYSNSPKIFVHVEQYDTLKTLVEAHLPSADAEVFMNKVEMYESISLIGDGEYSIIPVSKKNYFYVENTTNAEETVTITKNGNAPICSFEISTNTFTWTKLGNTSSTPLTITLPAGEKRYLRGENGVHLSNWPIWSEYTGITGMDKVGGNIHSLLFGENFENTELTAPGDGGQTSAYGLAFANLFYGSTTLVDAGDLILPSKVVPHYGYSNMFMECSNLTTPPQIEAVTSVGSNNMGGIFSNCTSLTRTPVLKIEAIPQYCYDHAFSGCSSLTRVENWATSGNDNDQPGAPTDSWLDGVAAEGTFVKNPNASNWVFGKNGIPTGWTVVDK